LVDRLYRFDGHAQSLRIEMRRRIIAYDECPIAGPLRTMTYCRALLTASLLVLGTACVSVTTLDGERLTAPSAEFRAYIEAVFREQNRVATDLAFALESDAAAESLGEIETAESELIAACTSLNEIATERRAGRELSRQRQIEAAKSAPQCEQATRAAAVALQSARGEAPNGN
jgi:hypothetical protein